LISERSFQVLRAIVEDYVQTSEPVGSKALLERHALGVSSATIRNDMALLEDEGFIHAPHTSAGRIPTDSGYRLFVDRLNELKRLSSPEKFAIETMLSSANNLDELLGKSVRVLSQLTNQVAMIQYPTLVSARIRSVELVSVSESKIMVILVTDNGRVQQTIVDCKLPSDSKDIESVKQSINTLLVGTPLPEVRAKVSTGFPGLDQTHDQLGTEVIQVLLELIEQNTSEKIVLAGTGNLARADGEVAGDISQILDAIEENVVLLRLFSEMKSDQNDVELRIGSESQINELSHASLLVSSYAHAGVGSSKVAVLGPTRMDYSNNIAAVKAIARYLSKSLGE